jgi:predicted nucleotidyltransferase
MSSQSRNVEDTGRRIGWIEGGDAVPECRPVQTSDPVNHRRQDGLLENAASACYTKAMERDVAITRLREHEAELKRLGVQHLWLFGSTARGEARDDSDVDLFFDHEKGKLSLFGLMDVKKRASQIRGSRFLPKAFTVSRAPCTGRRK